MPQKPQRILIVDDHDIVRFGLRRFLERRSDWLVVGEANNGRKAVELARECTPDIVIMDISMPEMNGLEATRRILSERPQTKVLILTMHDSDEVVGEILASGARGFLAKSTVSADLGQALDTLVAGKPYLSSALSEAVLRIYTQRPTAAPAPGASRVTGREREVLQALAEGKTNKEIAAALHVSVRTVETHRANLMEKLELHSLGELIRYAIRNHVVS